MLTVKEKIGYGLGDTASNIVFQSVMMFLAFYYTDVFGISSAAVGTIFLLVRCIDAVADPLMGALADRTHTRWGKFRPYILWMALPFALISVLAFTTPDLGPDGKVIYAFITYALLMFAYTAINIPYCALGGVLTSDLQERVSLQSYRFVLAMVGGLLVSSCTLPLVEYLGEGSRTDGYQRAIMVMSALGFVLFISCFALTRERVVASQPSQQSVRQDVLTLLRNDQWRVLALINFLVLAGLALRGAAALYYVNYVVGREDLASLFITINMLGALLGGALGEPIAKRVDKVKAYAALQLSLALIGVLFFFVPSTWIISIFALNFLFGLVAQAASPLLWAKLADVVDYCDWRDGHRLTGISFSAILFFHKFGLAIGGAICGWVLAIAGYQAGVAQSESSQLGILLCFTVLPSVFFALIAAVSRQYKLNLHEMTRIQTELQARTSGAGV